MRLLIAEDEKDIVRALTALFEHNHYSVDSVYNGNDAYDYAMAGNYDGIIMDVMMPGTDGIEVLRRLRLEGLKTPILLLTAKGDIEDKVTGLDAGGDDYLVKPIEVDKLLKEGKATVKVLSSKDKWFGVTYKEDKPYVMDSIQKLKDAGIYPDVLWN